MPDVELIYDADCPHVELARAVVLEAFAAAGLRAEWREWDRGSGASPDYARQFASPTVLVDGRDVAADGANALLLDGAAACRLYPCGAGLNVGAPSVEMIVAALLSHRGPGAER